MRRLARQKDGLDGVRAEIAADLRKQFKDDLAKEVETLLNEEQVFVRKWKRATRHKQLRKELTERFEDDLEDNVEMHIDDIFEELEEEKVAA